MGSNGHAERATALSPNGEELAEEKLVPDEINEKVVVDGAAQPGVGGPQIGKVPFTALDGSTVTFAMVTSTPTRFACCAYWSGLFGSIVDTVTTFALRLMEKIGTGTKLSGVEIAVSDEMFALCAKPAGADSASNKQTRIQCRSGFIISTSAQGVDEITSAVHGKYVESVATLIKGK